MIPDAKLERIKQKIRSSCCGVGCNKCAKKIGRFTKYAVANIPVMYWELPFSKFSGDPNFQKHVTEIISDLEFFFDEGTSYAFIGNLGTGKSYAACCILKKSISDGYSGRYTQMAEIVNDILTNKVSMQEYTEHELLVIDEFDPRWVFPSEKVEKIFGTTFEFILRTRFQNKMPTILCSNADIDSVLSNDFAKAFASLRSMYMKDIFVAGKDFRKNVKTR